MVFYEAELYCIMVQQEHGRLMGDKDIVHLKVRKGKPEYSFILKFEIRAKNITPYHRVKLQRALSPFSSTPFYMNHCAFSKCTNIFVMSGAAKSSGKYYHPTSKQTVFCVVDKGEACGEVNGTGLLALSLSLPGLTV